MPEGDVVHRTAARLHAALSGHEITASDIRWPSLATLDLRGRRVLETVARGKHILTRLDGSLTLHSHLRMEGSWHVHPTGERFTARPADGIRIILSTEPWTAVGHRLGMLDVVATSAEAELVGHLGPDVLGPDWNLVVALEHLAAAPHRPVGAALLDQRNLAGIGTFYMSEALFLAGLTPWTPVRDVRRLRDVVGLTRRLMSANLDRVAQTTTGNTRNGENAYVHGRHRKPCRRCGTPIRVEMVGEPPLDRTAFFCPRCQQGPYPEGTMRDVAALRRRREPPDRRRRR